jgi:Zn-dependent M28 family amino/carboxypeptidase
MTAGSPLSSEALMAHVRVLTAPELAGRQAGSDGERKAADYVVGQLERAAIERIGEWRHAFPLSSGPGKQDSVNVLGALRSTGPRREEWIVIGAHIDHLGARGDGLYLGAEDNASGVAVLLGMALELAKRRAELDRSLLLAFFGGEEVGLVGSRAFVSAPPVPLSKIRAMVNIDMIGRPLADMASLTLPKIAARIDDERSVGLVGGKDRPELRKIADDAFASESLRVVAGEDMPGPIASIIEGMTRARGDYWPFEQKGIPALFFSSGESDDYHKPTDTADRLRPDIMAGRARAIVRVVLALSRKP